MRIPSKFGFGKNRRGFTLVELMIVVAIIGVLAALAIYGVRKYLTNAKTAEARMAVGRIAKDASSAYIRENMEPGVLAFKGVAAATNRLCPSAAKAVPENATSIKGQKYQSAPSEWEVAGWSCLRFSMTDPQYFQYNYTASGSGSAAGDAFAAVAQGDLDGDGVLSTFTLDAEVRAEGNVLVLVTAPSITEGSPDE